MRRQSLAGLPEGNDLVTRGVLNAETPTVAAVVDNLQDGPQNLYAGTVYADRVIEDPNAKLVALQQTVGGGTVIAEAPSTDEETTSSVAATEVLSSKPRANALLDANIDAIEGADATGGAYTIEGLTSPSLTNSLTQDVSLEQLLDGIESPSSDADPVSTASILSLNPVETSFKDLPVVNLADLTTSSGTAEDIYTEFR